MSGKHLGQHEISTVGVSTVLAFTNASARTQLITDSGDLPATFLLRATQDCYVRQGDATAEAGTSDFRLKKDEAIKITILDDASSYIAAERVSTNGNLVCTRNNSKTPGTGTSA
jgi:hypothetical protein